MDQNQNRQYVNNTIAFVTQQPPTLVANPIGSSSSYQNDCVGTFVSSNLTGAIEVWGTQTPVGGNGGNNAGPSGPVVSPTGAAAAAANNNNVYSQALQAAKTALTSFLQ
jgi:hypothetical protein